MTSVGREIGPNVEYKTNYGKTWMFYFPKLVPEVRPLRQKHPNQQALIMERRGKDTRRSGFHRRKEGNGTIRHRWDTWRSITIGEAGRSQEMEGGRRQDKTQIKLPLNVSFNLLKCNNTFLNNTGVLQCMKWKSIWLSGTNKWRQKNLSISVGY